ncbi:MAG: hypothetical protein NUW08_01305, partial [Candidatus Uhrbacteria bacterium]|nr:hypothetical protein [Candidatus Uhrbacteria bacterium]
IEAGTGRMMYPIAEVYRPGDLPFLGEAFTQAQCGKERIEELYPDGLYSWGSSLRLKAAPSSGLSDALTNAGFQCRAMEDEACLGWELKKSVELNLILRLEPYSDEMASEDCILCG